MDAYSLGLEDALRGVTERWEQALSAPMPAPGAMNEPLESLYRRTEALRRHVDELTEALEASYALNGDAARLRQFEQWAEKGACPNLINDDNGRWAVSFEGTQPVVTEDHTETFTQVSWVEPHQWRDTVAEAIDAAIEESKNEPT